MELVLIGFLCLAMFILLLLLILLKRKEPLDKLSERPVLITGCDMGLGHDLAVALCKVNVPVYATCLTQNGIDSLRSKVCGLLGADHFFTPQMDVRDRNSCEKVLNFVKETTGGKGLWAVVCNAGVLGYPVVDDWLTPEMYSEVLSVNLLGTIRTCQLFKPLLLPLRGRMVFVGSMLGKLALPSLGPYCVSKFGVEAYADITRHESRAFGITVHTIAPGFFSSHLTSQNRISDLVEKAWLQTSQSVKDFFGVPYKEGLTASMVKGLQHFAARDSGCVIDACLDALTSKYPKIRYAIGLDSRISNWLSACPPVLHDWFIELSYSLYSAPVPTYCLENMQEWTDGFLVQRRIKSQNETWKRSKYFCEHVE